MKLFELLQQEIPPQSHLEVFKRIVKRPYDDYRILAAVRVAKVDALWKGDGEYYIGKGGGHQGKGKYNNGMKYIFYTNKPINAPILGVLYQDGKILLGFDDGRHTFAVMRDMGMPVTKVAMDKESYRNAKKAGLVV